jgi:hypothetical protein
MTALLIHFSPFDPYKTEMIQEEGGRENNAYSKKSEFPVLINT